jgi:hypothetical protein
VKAFTVAFHYRRETGQRETEGNLSTDGMIIRVTSKN